MRRCLRCGRGPITACNGFVLARDLLLAQAGKLPYHRVREHCGVCAGFFIIMDQAGFGDVVHAYLRSIPNFKCSELP